LLLLCLIASLTVVVLTGVSRAEPLPRSVLILDESGPAALNPGYIEISKAFRSTLIAEAPARIYGMNLDLQEFSGPQHYAMLQKYLADKYRDVPIGVLFAVGPSALAFAVQARSELWPNTPIVFAAADEASAAQILATISNVTGRTLRFSLARSVELARAIMPGLKQVVLVGDPFEKQPFRTHFKEELPRAATDLTLIDLTGLPLAEVKKRVSALPDDAVILYTAITNDGAGTTVIPSEVSQAIADVANRPIMIDVDNRIDRGGTGGRVVAPALVGEEAAQLVLRIFNGDSATQIPISVSDAMRPVFDWRKLKYWGIDERQLPPESDIRFRPPAAWDQYRLQIIAVLLTVLLQSALIGALMYEDRRRRAAEARSAILSTELAHVNRVATAGELAASIAHEIRQPLAAIVARGSAGLNWLKRTPLDMDKVRSALENIVENGHRADEVLKNTRAMFQKEETPQVRLNINSLVGEFLAHSTHRLDAKQIRLRTDFVETPLPMVRVNRTQLQQVLLNLIMNAIEAMSAVPSGDRLLTLRTAVNDAGRVLVTVQDSGPGIAPEHLDRIFKSFFTTKPSGMGLGLSICKSIVEAHGGTLKAMPGVPVGTVFTIDLRLSRRLQRSADVDEPSASSQSGGFTPDRRTG
jgi:signal transduction histidine kinase